MFIRNAWYIAAWADEIGGHPARPPHPQRARRAVPRRAGTTPPHCSTCAATAARRCTWARSSSKACNAATTAWSSTAPAPASTSPARTHILERTRVRSFPVVEQDAFLWIWMGDPAKADPAAIVPWPYHNDAVNWPHRHTMYPIKAAAMLMVDNLMDLTHLGYVHTSTIGGNPSQHVEAKMETERTPLGLRFTRWMLNSLPPPTYVKAVGFEGRIDRCQRFEFVAPGSVLQWTGADEAGALPRRRHAATASWSSACSTA